MSRKKKPDRTVTFGAVGDIELSRDCGRQVEASGFAWPFQEMMPHLSQADLLFGNMESIVLPSDYPDDRIDPEGLVSKFDGTPALKEAGFDFLNFAANHVLDGGPASMFHTRELVEGLGIATAGAGRTQQEARQMRVLEAGGLKFGFLCYCEDNNYSLGTTGPCHAYFTPAAALEDIAANRARVDVLVVSVHADLEFMETPSPPRREQFRRLTAAGATVVLGHHPHVPQGVELIGGSLIAYSLGNFYFPAHSDPYMAEHGPHTGHSFLLLAEVSAGGVESFRRVPFEIAPPPNQRPVPLTGPAGEEMLAYLAELDRKCRDDELVGRNWRRKALEHLAIYLQRVKDQDMDVERLLEELLGRLLLVDENRSWTAEVFEAVKENWAAQRQRRDEHHRPNHVLMSRWKK